MIQEIEEIVERLYYAGKDTGLMITTDHASRYVKDLERMEKRGILTTRDIIDYLKGAIYELEYSLTKSEVDTLNREIKIWYRRSKVREIIKEEWATRMMVYMLTTYRRRFLHRKQLAIVLMGKEKQISFQVQLAYKDIKEVVQELGEKYEEDYQKYHENMKAIEEKKQDPTLFKDLYRSRIGVKSKHIRTNVFYSTGDTTNTGQIKQAYLDLKGNEYREYMRVRYIQEQVVVTTRKAMYHLTPTRIEAYREGRKLQEYNREVEENVYEFMYNFVRAELSSEPKEIKNWLLNEYVINASDRGLF